jgi:hypothetical protein
MQVRLGPYSSAENPIRHACHSLLLSLSLTASRSHTPKTRFNKRLCTYRQLLLGYALRGSLSTNFAWIDIKIPLHAGSWKRDALGNGPVDKDSVLSGGSFGNGSLENLPLSRDLIIMCGAWRKKLRRAWKVQSRAQYRHPIYHRKAVRCSLIQKWDFLWFDHLSLPDLNSIGTQTVSRVEGERSPVFFALVMVQLTKADPVQKLRS